MVPCNRASNTFIAPETERLHCALAQLLHTGAMSIHQGATVKLIKLKSVPTKLHPYKDRQYHTVLGLYECHCGKRRWLKPAKAKTLLSCGCGAHPKTHGPSLRSSKDGKRNPLYNLWGSVKSRCTNSDHPYFHRYGGRGITMCDEWINDPAAFASWALSNGWKQGLSIERIDNDAGYSPANCKFIPRGQQARNRSTSKLTMKQVQTIRACYDSGLATNSELARRYNVTPTTMCNIVHRKIWREEGGAS